MNYVTWFLCLLCDTPALNQRWQIVNGSALHLSSKANRRKKNTHKRMWCWQTIELRKQTDGKSIKVLRAMRDFELLTSDLLYTSRDSASCTKTSTRGKQILLSSLYLSLIPWLFPSSLWHRAPMASRTVWIFLLFTKEGFSLAQKIKGHFCLLIDSYPL